MLDELVSEIRVYLTEVAIRAGVAQRQSVLGQLVSGSSVTYSDIGERKDQETAD